MLYQLSAKKQEYQKVKRVTLDKIGWKELDLQRLLSKHMQDLIDSDDLMTIFNERQGKEEPDILALDQKGDLYLFELKRWGSDQENLLQVLRYGQLFGNSNYERLNELFHKYTGAQESLSEMHKSYFGLDDVSCIKKEEFNQRQHYLVITNGLDQKTVEAITFWKKSGLDLNAVVYWVFEINGEYFIEFNMYSPLEGFLEYERNSYVLNTNFAHNKQHNEDMLRERKAAAYYPGWREKIQRLQKGDTVFLYKSGTGIVAYGIASGILEKRDCDGKKEYEYCMSLEQFKILKTPMPASEMREVTNKGFPFRTTLFSITDESKEQIINRIEKLHMGTESN